MKKIMSLLKFLPKLIDYIPVMLSILSVIKARWWVKILLFLLFLIVFAFISTILCNPYSVDLTHPVDTAGRIFDTIKNHGEGLRDLLPVK